MNYRDIGTLSEEELDNELRKRLGQLLISQVPSISEKELSLFVYKCMLIIQNNIEASKKNSF